MNIKSYAGLRELTITKVRALCNEHLGLVPADLSEDQISKLDGAIASAAKSLISSESNDLVNVESQAIDVKTVEIIGVKTLQKNLLLYLRNAKNKLDSEKFNIDNLVFQIEQKFYTDLSGYQQKSNNDSLVRMQRNANIWSSQGIKNIQSDDEEEIELLESLENLMSEFAI